MQVISYEMTRWRLEGEDRSAELTAPRSHFMGHEDVQVTELGPYSEVVAETCNYMRSSLDGTSYKIRVSQDCDVFEVQIDELEEILSQCRPGLVGLAVQLVKPDRPIEKTVRIERVTRRNLTRSNYRFWMNHLHGANLPEEDERHEDERHEEKEDRYEREEMEREKWDEWTRGGGQGCGNCIDVCRCMSRGYDSD